MTNIPPTSSTPLRSHRIRSVSVVGGFLDGLRLELADGLNCFIGGRGTGKTTVLEFVRFAFDALPSRDEDSDERRRIESLVEQNLAGGRVQVEFQTKNGLTYVVSRSWDEEPVVLTADGQATESHLRHLEIATPCNEVSCAHGIWAWHQESDLAAGVGDMVMVPRFAEQLGAGPRRWRRTGHRRCLGLRFAGGSACRPAGPRRTGDWSDRG